MHISLEIDFFFFFAFIVHSSFESIKGERGANVSNEAHDEEIPLEQTLLYYSWRPFPLLKLRRKVLNGLMRVSNGPTKLVNVMRLMLQNGY
jgi:hypothetical protein